MIRNNIGNRSPHLHNFTNSSTQTFLIKKAALDSSPDEYEYDEDTLTEEEMIIIDAACPALMLQRGQRLWATTTQDVRRSEHLPTLLAINISPMYDVKSFCTMCNCSQSVVELKAKNNFKIDLIN
jgi:hypothetical protein